MRPSPFISQAAVPVRGAEILHTDVNGCDTPERTHAKARQETHCHSRCTLWEGRRRRAKNKNSLSQKRTRPGSTRSDDRIAQWLSGRWNGFRGMYEHEERTWRRGKRESAWAGVGCEEPAWAGKKPERFLGWRASGNCDLETVSATWVQDEMTKDLEEVTRGRKDNKEVTKEEGPVGQDEAKKPGPGGVDGGPE